MTDPVSRASEAQHPVDDEVLLASLWRRGRRAAVIGAAIGLGTEVVIVVGLALLIGWVDPTGDATDLTAAEAISLLPFTVMPVVFGAMIGLTVAGWSVAQRMVGATGSRAEARRTRDIVMRGAAPTGPADEARALRWARIAAVYVPYQTLTFGLLFVGLLSNQIRTLIAPPDGAVGALAWTSAVFIVALFAASVALVPFMLRNGRRARAYADRASRRRPDGSAGATFPS